MNGMPWVKMYTEMLDDVKLSRLPDTLKWRFVQLVLLAGECDAEGALVTGESPMTLEDIAWRLRLDAQTIQKDIEVLSTYNLIKIENGVVWVVKFSERQGPTQAEKREQWRNRQKERRERSKVDNVTRDSPESHELEEEEEEELINGAKAPRKPSEKEQARLELEKQFLIFTHLPKPTPRNKSEHATYQKLWANPLREMLSLAGGDISKAMEWVKITKLRLSTANLTDPNSYIKTFRSVYADKVGKRAEDDASEVY